MNRTIQTTTMSVTRLTLEGEDAVAWLCREMADRHLPYLLAHADDGVIWGRLTERGLTTSHDVLQADPHHRRVSPPLRALTLQQARAFSETAELLLWRDGEGRFQSRLIADGPGAVMGGAQRREYIDEPQMLWGDTRITDCADCARHGFTLWREGAQEMLHAIPFASTSVPPLLGVRHYLADMPTAQIELSRLTGLFPADGAAPGYSHDQERR